MLNLPGWAQESAWGKLLDANKIAAAERLCTGMSKKAEVATRVEAEKCLANIALSKGATMSLPGDDIGGGTVGAGYSPASVDAALLHLNKGLKLAPQDLSLHQGRLHVLETAGRFDGMVSALDESASVYKGADALQAWLAYDSELADDGQARAGLTFSEMLNRHYPDSHDVVGNIGAFHSMLREPEVALPYLRKAVALAPKDPIDCWNLGWALDKTGAIVEADKWMSRSMALEADGKDVPDRNCLYAEFVEKKLGDIARGCTLEKASCEAKRQTACKQVSQ